MDIEIDTSIAALAKANNNKTYSVKCEKQLEKTFYIL
jgi:hypothetical protein